MVNKEKYISRLRQESDNYLSFLLDTDDNTTNAILNSLFENKIIKYSNMDNAIEDLLNSQEQLLEELTVKREDLNKIKRRIEFIKESKVQKKSNEIIQAEQAYNRMYSNYIMKHCTIDYLQYKLFPQCNYISNEIKTEQEHQHQHEEEQHDNDNNITQDNQPYCNTEENDGIIHGYLNKNKLLYSKNYIIYRLQGKEI